MKKDWWFKFEHLKWLTDEQLNRCSLETQGFWIRCICVMRKSGSAAVEGTGPELSRLLNVTPAEFRRCFLELTKTKAADVTLSHASVTHKSAIFRIVSRKIKSELTTKEKNKLRKRKERRHTDVTPKSQPHNKSKSKEEEKNKNIHTDAGDFDAVDAHALGYPLADFFKFFPRLTITPGQMGMILSEVKDNAIDREAWAATMEQYVGNYDPSTKTYMPEKVGNVLSLFKTKRKEVENNGSGKNNSGRYTKRTDQDVIEESAEFYRDWQERESDLPN